jgi:NADH-quinone oxidoreductase subunit L
MEGPTPASALIHSATMVVAGIFLIIRVSFTFQNENNFLLVIIIIAIITILIASGGALGEQDFKRIIAQSTVSQLGYMLLACGLSQFIVSFYLIFTHSLCKALLFLIAGSIIHINSDEQDIRKFGSQYQRLPILFSLFLIGVFTLIGFLFSSLHFSKDILLKSLINQNSSVVYIIYTILFISILIGSIYMLFIGYIIFIQKTNLKIVLFQHNTEVSLGLLVILSILTICCYFTGY